MTSGGIRWYGDEFLVVILKIVVTDAYVYGCWPLGHAWISFKNKWAMGL